MTCPFTAFNTSACGKSLLYQIMSLCSSLPLLLLGAFFHNLHCRGRRKTSMLKTKQNKTQPPPVFSPQFHRTFLYKESCLSSSTGEETVCFLFTESGRPADSAPQESEHPRRTTQTISSVLPPRPIPNANSLSWLRVPQPCKQNCVLLS